MEDSVIPFDDELFWTKEEKEAEEKESVVVEIQIQNESTAFFDAILGKLHAQDQKLIFEAKKCNEAATTDPDIIKKLSSSLVFLCAENQMQEKWTLFRDSHQHCCNTLEIMKLSSMNYIDASEVKKNLNDFFRCLHLPNTNKLCLQSFCSPLLQPALQYMNKHQKILIVNRGESNSVLNLKKAATKFGLKMNHRMNSNLEFFINNDCITNSHVPTHFRPYIAIYELKTTTDIDTKIELVKHPDFSKMIVLLRSIVNSYAKQLCMHEESFGQVRVWGILQYSTQIWFLQCSPIILPQPSSQQILITYWITYYTFDIQSDTQQVCNMYYKILCEDAKIMHQLLQEFTQTVADKYMSTAMASSKVFKTYKVVLCSTKIGYAVMSKFYQNEKPSFVTVSTEKSSKDYQEFVGMVQRTLNCKLVNITTISDPLKFISTHKAQFSENYILVQDSEYFLEQYLKNNKQEEQFAVFFKNHTNQHELCIAYFSRTKSADSQSEAIELASDFSAEQQQTNYSTNTMDKPVPPRIVSDREWMNNALLRLFKCNSTLSQIEPLVRKDDSLFGRVKRNNSVHFVKISRSLRGVEAISVMNQLVSQQLYHNHILRVYDYKIYSYDGCLLTVTETEQLESFSIAMKQVNTYWIRDWLLPHVVIPSLDALEMLHSKSIIHGDVSLMNLMFRKQGQQYVAVWIDMNTVFDYTIFNLYPEQLQYRVLCGVGTIGFFPEHKEEASVYTDCYGVIIVFCVLVYFGVFKHYYILFREDHRLNFEQLSQLFVMQNEKTKWSEEEVQFMKVLQRLFEKIVISKEEGCSATELKQLFQQCLDKES